MANYNGPYEEIPWREEPFPNGGGCPIIWALEGEGTYKGPGWTASGENLIQGYTSSCNSSWKYVLHHIEATSSTVHYTNQNRCPNSWGNQQGISVRYTTSNTYDVYGNSKLAAQYYDYTNCEEQPDGKWEYDYTTYKTTMVFILVPSYDDLCPTGTIYNANTGTCDLIPGYVWDPGSGTYIPEYCLQIEGESTLKILNEQIQTVYRFKLTKVSDYPDGDNIPVLLDEKVTVYLDFDDGTALYGTDFTMDNIIEFTHSEMWIEKTAIVYKTAVDKQIVIKTQENNQCEAFMTTSITDTRLIYPGDPSLPYGYILSCALPSCTVSTDPILTPENEDDVYPPGYVDSGSLIAKDTGEFITGYCRNQLCIEVDVTEVGEEIGGLVSDDILYVSGPDYLLTKISTVSDGTNCIEGTDIGIEMGYKIYRDGVYRTIIYPTCYSGDPVFTASDIGKRIKLSIIETEDERP